MFGFNVVAAVDKEEDEEDADELSNCVVDAADAAAAFVVVDESMETPGLSRSKSTSEEVDEVDGDTGP